MNEALNAQSVVAATVAQMGAVMEGGHLHGTYQAVCRGYKEEHKDEYLAKHPKLLELRAKRDQVYRYTPSFAKGLMSKFFKELEDFEKMMDDLCEVKWASPAPNVVTTLGANLALDTLLAGSSYTVVGPFMGLIGAVSYGAGPVIGDTMSSHGGWTEAGTTNLPTYTSPRKTVSFSSAASKSKASTGTYSYAITGTGTVKGVFLVLNTGAVSTIDNTSGTLYSAGLFTGGDQPVVNTNTVTVTYTASM